MHEKGLKQEACFHDMNALLMTVPPCKSMGHLLISVVLIVSRGLKDYETDCLDINVTL